MTTIQVESPRPYAQLSIDGLFEEILADLADAQHLVTFAASLTTEPRATIEAAAVHAFIRSLNERVENLTDALPVMIDELKQREHDALKADADPKKGR
ncbi:MAG: hypothetical protein OEY86_07150 [Nitrospira sp.]|nr:hypothetical protein [Nitrospira sp.]